jgi:hypothetical protein
MVTLARVAGGVGVAGELLEHATDNPTAARMAAAPAARRRIAFMLASA